MIPRAGCLIIKKPSLPDKTNLFKKKILNEYFTAKWCDTQIVQTHTIFNGYPDFYLDVTALHSFFGVASLRPASAYNSRVLTHFSRRLHYLEDLPIGQIITTHPYEVTRNNNNSLQTFAFRNSLNGFHCVRRAVCEMAAITKPDGIYHKILKIVFRYAIYLL